MKHSLVVALMFALGCGAGGAAGDPNGVIETGSLPECPPTEPTTPVVQKSDPSRYVLVDFSNPAHRATLTEDGIEHFMTDGPWAIYRVTSDQPRIYIPGVVEPDHSQFLKHRTALCSGMAYFAPLDRRASTSIRLKGFAEGATEPTKLVALGSVENEFGNCGGAMDMRALADGTQQYDGLYLEFDPAPPVGSLVPLMMVAAGAYDSLPPLPHLNESWRVCCQDANGCSAIEPPGQTNPPDAGVPDGGPPADGGGPGNEPQGGGGGGSDGERPADGGTTPHCQPIQPIVS